MMTGKNWRKVARSACIAGMGRGKAASKLEDAELYLRMTCLGSILAIAVHLQALAEVHQALINLSCFCQCCSCGLRISGTLRTCGR
jgi:hypothetical protein